MSDARGMVAVGVLSLALATIVSACGGGGGGSCGQVAPCGGNVVGNWNVSGACLESAVVDTGPCAGATVSATITSISGTVAFNADLSYATTTTASFALRETLPASCLQAMATATNCAALDQQFQEQMAMDPSITSARCVGDGDCTCLITSGPRTTAEVGTYSTSGTTLTFFESDGTSESNEYCLQGNALHVMALDPAMPIDAMGRPNVQAETVLTRR